MSSPVDEVLEDIFQRLANKSDEIRTRAADDLRVYVNSIAQVHSGNDTSKDVWADLFHYTFDLTRSNNVYDRLGACAAIDAMLETTNDDTPDRALQKDLRLFEYLRPLLTCTDSSVMVAAARVVGNMVRIAGATLGESFFSKEIGQALQMLEDSRQEVGRFAGVLILHQFASNAPPLFYPFTVRVLERIWQPLRDSRTMVRERASMLLSACLEICKTRDKDPTLTFTKIFDEGKSVMQKGGPTDAILGSMLAFGAMLQNQHPAMQNFFQPICDATLKYRESKEVVIRKAVITLIPNMATFNPDAFEEHYLKSCMAYILSALHKPTDRDIAYVAMGHMSVQLNTRMRPYLDDVVRTIKDHLRQRGKKGAPFEAPIFQCLAMLTTSVGPSLTSQMHEILDLMLPWGISEALFHALEVIASHIPPLLPTIQKRLLDTLSLVLIGSPYRPLGAPPPRGLGVHSAQAPAQSPETLALALRILGTFDFSGKNDDCVGIKSGHVLNEFVREAAMPYLEHDSPEVRKEAVLASTQLLIHDPICQQTSIHAIEIVSDILGKLLTVGITDPSPPIRQTVLEHLDAKFDRHLAQAEDIRCLFIALNDEVFHNRELAIGIIGRLATHNPAHVMPPLRKSLINLITELEFSTATKQKEESAQLLCLLIGAAASLVKSYAPTILTVLLRIAAANDTPVQVVAHCVTGIGELARVAGEELVPEVTNLLALLVNMLNDQTSAIKRNAALKTLGQIASNTGAVVQPYAQHPQLLGILFRMLRTETNQTTRLETIRTMGMLGALDPFRHKMIQGGIDDPNADTAGPRVTDITLLMNISTPSNDDYYQTVVVNSLVNVLNDSSMKELHYEAIQAVMLIFRSQQLRSVSFLPQILPAFLNVIRIASVTRQEVYLKQLANLISIVKQHVRNYLDDVFDLIHDFWNPNSKLQITIIQLVEAVARAVEGEFKAYLPRLLQQILRSFDGDLATKHIGERRLQTLLHILRAFYVFGSNIEDYLHLVLPVVVKSFENPHSPDELRKAALRTTGQLCRKVNFTDHASQIIHPLVRTLANGDHEVKNIAMDTLCVLLLQFGADYAIFIPMVNKAMAANRIIHPQYESLVTKLLNRERLPPDLGPVEHFSSDPIQEASVSAEQTRLPVNQQQLKPSWDCSLVTSKGEWIEWVKKLGNDLMRESPCQAIRASRSLAEVHQPFAKELFNVAFVSCWTELYESYQEDLTKNLQSALSNNIVPPDVINVILGLAEFMEHDEKTLAIEARVLGDYATVFHAYAKALHYKEQEFFIDASVGVVEDLISINQKLQQSDAAWGTLEYATHNMDMTTDVLWFEKLGRWDEALSAWNEMSRNPDSPYAETRIAHGKCHALHALGEWEELSSLIQVRWAAATVEDKRVMAPLAATASWSLNQWDLMDDYIAAMKNETADRSFFKAILSVHRNQYSQAQRHIMKAREKLDGELTSLTGESYGRAYDVVVRVQMLSELEEVISYKDHMDAPERQATQRRTWQRRLSGCQRDVEVWQRILQLRSMVLTPKDDTKTWLHFADLCRTSDRLTLAEKTLTALVGNSSLDTDTRSRAPPEVIFAYLRLQWAQSAKDPDEGERIQSSIASISYLREFTGELANDIGIGALDANGALVIPDEKVYGEYTDLLAQCHVELGQWQASLKVPGEPWDPTDLIQDYRIATELSPTWYKAWHTWALSNFEVITQLETSHDGLSTHHFNTYIIPAVEGFLRSISLSPGNALQDTLRLLTLWFDYGYQIGVNQAISDGLHTVSIDVWLEVIPQIIARVQTPRATIQALIIRLLHDVGKAHPQALIYPLTVAAKSNVNARKSVALNVMAKMREHSNTIVDQAEMISTELIRAAILWHEMWYDGLEEASKYYFADQNIPGMYQVLEPLHEMVERGPETLRETSFVQSFGHDLRVAREHLTKYTMHGDNTEIQQAWDIYYSVFQRLGKQLKLLTVIELQYVSPRLMLVRDLDIAVPGTYQSGKPVIGIQRVLQTFTVITSKQRPRKFSMKGMDGKEYTYCLKGHEDLRQDERVMQLFGLVNTLLAADQEAAKRHLSVQAYSVTPLSPGAGLLGWVQNSDTLHMLIKGYRESRKILVDIEHRLMQQMADENYDSLPLLHKVEVFNYALDNTTGQDLYRILWLRSRNSESWLERRVTYTRSLGVNSMVGYILGLGDRHPSNLLLDQITGKVVHIDFGDCFEVAQQRDKYPEKVPFRLTRMLIHAMEVCGIQGTFSKSCEVSMGVARSNRESLMAVLEAFVYDPLLAWRLTAGAAKQPGGRVEDEMDEAGARVRKNKANETDILNDAGHTEVKNDKALEVVDRVRRKLTGRDFKGDQTLDVKSQVEKLVEEATKTENLCVAFLGWCSFW